MPYDLIVIGGGPAGAAAAITASRRGARVLLLERGRYPRHKVCGEFVSPESLSLLASLLRGTRGEELLREAPRVGRTRLYSDGAILEARIEPAASSLPRYRLDEALWRAAESSGVECRQQTAVNGVEATREGFRVTIGPDRLAAHTVIDASGRCSNLAPPRPSFPLDCWMGVKAHLAGEPAEADPAVDLYFFRDGYCGVQPVGEGNVNACAMVRATALAKSSPDRRLQQIFGLHPRLQQRSRQWQQASGTVTTWPLMFRAPDPQRGGIPRVGDAAGFIDPFAGDGISLALAGGSMAAEALAEVWAARATAEEAAHRYAEAYSRRMVPVFRAAARLRRFLQAPSLLRRSALEIARFLGLGSILVRTTRAAGETQPVFQSVSLSVSQSHSGPTEGLRQ